MKILFCSECGNVVSPESESYENGNLEQIYICEECSPQYTWCYDCSEFHSNEEYTYCDWCDEPIAPCQRSHRDSSGTRLCDDCYDRCRTCDDCGMFLNRDDVYRYSGDTLCESCYDSIRNDDSSDVLFSYSYKPYALFYGSGPVFMGVELEVDDGEDRDRCVREILSLANTDDCMLYAKEDGSLDYGFEIVSMPATLEYHLSYFPWLKTMEIAKRYNFRSHMTETCGLHVHVNRTAFGSSFEEQEFGIAKLMYMVELFWEQMVSFSRRTYKQLEQWANRYGLEIQTEKVDSLYKKACIDNQQKRYYAINLQNSETVEVRLFRGTLKYSTFSATLQFVQLLVDIALKLSLTEVQALTWPELINEGQDYRELQDYLQNRGLI